MKRIRKVVSPVAGLGTQFLPATKAVPMEMPCVVVRAVVQHVLDKVRAAGIKHFIFAAGRNKAVTEDHFDIAYVVSNAKAVLIKGETLKHTSDNYLFDLYLSIECE